jgi:hypothetical protein
MIEGYAVNSTGGSGQSTQEVPVHTVVHEQADKHVFTTSPVITR